MPNSFSSLYKIIEVEFKDESLLKEALTHPSTQSSKDYERLEFLGDRVLGFIVADILLTRFPKETEGQLARRHSGLVRKETLAAIALSINLDQYINVVASERKTGGHKNPSVLANCCESLIAALYLDQGIDTVRRFIETYWESYFNQSIMKQRDAKSRLQEWAQGNGLSPPKYDVLSKRGSDHKPIFTIEVQLAGYKPMRSEGTSKRLTEQHAAQKMLAELKVKDDDS